MESVSDDQYFKPNLNLPKYQLIQGNNKDLLNNNFIPFLTQIKDLYFKELIALSKKYQNTFETFSINDTCLLNFTDEVTNFSKDEITSSFLFVKSIKLNASNKFRLRLSLIPKFSKAELAYSIDIVNDILLTDITFSIYYESLDLSFIEEDKINVYFSEQPGLNQLSDSFTNKLKSTFIRFLTESAGNYVNGLNKFCNYLQNYLPECMKENLDFDFDPWSYNEQKSFLLYQDEILSGKSNIETSDLNKVFIYLGGKMRTKTGKQCLERAKLIQSALLKDKTIPEKLISTNNSIVGLVDEIYNDFLLLKSEVLAKILTFEESQHITTTGNEKSQVLDLVEENEEEEYEESEDMDMENLEGRLNEEDLDFLKKQSIENPNFDKENRLKKAKKQQQEANQGSSKDPKNYSYDKNKPNSQQYHLQQILLLSDKYNLISENVIFSNISLISLSSQCSLYISCKVCQKSKFDAKFVLFPNHIPLFYMGTYCPYCSKNIYIIIKPEFIHDSNKSLIAEVFAFNCIVLDYLPSKFEANCLNCLGQESESVIKFMNVSAIKTYYSQCMSCYGKNELRLGTLSVVSKVITASKYLKYIENYSPVSYFSNYTVELPKNDEFIQKYYKIGELGNGLPNHGVCPHYKNSFRWFRFGCCYKLYPCDICHSTYEKHEMVLAKTCVCGFCSFEQIEENVICQYCKKTFVKNTELTQFWEGGKGQTDKSKMSNKDNHKFKGMNKTISRKKKNQK